MGRLLSIFTTATASGVAARDITMLIGAVLAVFGVLGWLTEDQVEALRGMVPGLIGALGGVVTVAVSVYRVITKSHSDKAAKAAKAIDDKVRPDAPVRIETPPGVPDIIIPGKVD